MNPVIIGVDPGANETGIVTRQGSELLWHEVIRGNGLSLPFYIEAVVMGCNVAAYRAPGHYELAVEDVVTPNPHMGMMNPKSLIGTAMVIGAVLSHFSNAIVVPPAKHGSGPLVAYPEALRPTRGKGAGKDRLRHCRSAWSIAGSAATMLRIGAA